MFFCKEGLSNLLIFTCMSHSVFEEADIIDLYENNPSSAVSLEITM